MKKTNKKFILDIWKDYSIKINNEILTETLIENSLSNFWKDIINNIDEKQYILIQFKIKQDSGSWKSISYVQTVLKKDYRELLDSFLSFWEIKSEEYYVITVSHINFTYKIVSLTSKLNESKIHVHPNLKLENKPKFRIYGNNLPNTMDLTEWGNNVYLNDKNVLVYKPLSKIVYHILLLNNYQKVEVKIKNKTLISFTDSMQDAHDLSTFTRIIKNQEYFFVKGKLIVKKVKRITSFLKPIKPSILRTTKFITMDLETRILGGIMSPYCVSIFDGNKMKSFYLTEYSSPLEMLENSIKYLMKRKYDHYKVYLHNFSHFDGIFLIKILSNLSNDIKPIIRDGRIIDLRFIFDTNKYSIYFRDSYLLLPSSLKKLAKNFNVEDKGVFPYSFVNDESIKLNYEGLIPEFKYYNDITKESYDSLRLKYSKEVWSLRNETIKYCEQDCKTLYKIIDSFSIKIFKLFRLDILNYPTLSSLAFGIYRCKFLGDAKIPLIHGDMFNDIKKGYTGGAVDVFKPYGKNIYRYDVNSLYPYVMKEYPMPVGNPVYFEGDISLIDNKAFGIFEVEVKSPDNINIPLLQVIVKTKNGKRTIAPIGEWTGTYLSEELYNTMKHNYTFQIKRGYLFDKGYIFKDYVDFLYELKVNSSKDSPDYVISKLLLNSLYGRLGMNPEMENHIIVNSDKALYYYDNYKVSNVLDLKNGKELISYFINYDLNSEDNYNKLNISIPISTAVTAYARIHMSQFKTMGDNNIYYSDTDSIDINKPLDIKFIGNELGKMKLEHIFKEAVFLAPKVYGGITDNYEYVRVKGLKNPIKFDNLLSLLIKNEKLEINQDKWYRNIAEGNIQIKNEVYTLMITDNKRNLIYDNNKKFISTHPIKLFNSNII